VPSAVREWFLTTPPRTTRPASRSGRAGYIGDQPGKLGPRTLVNRGAPADVSASARRWTPTRPNFDQVSCLGGRLRRKGRCTLSVGCVERRVIPSRQDTTGEENTMRGLVRRARAGLPSRSRTRDVGARGLPPRHESASGSPTKRPGHRQVEKIVVYDATYGARGAWRPGVAGIGTQSSTRRGAGRGVERSPSFACPSSASEVEQSLQKSHGAPKDTWRVVGSPERKSSKRCFLAYLLISVHWHTRFFFAPGTLGSGRRPSFCTPAHATVGPGS